MDKFKIRNLADKLLQNYIRLKHKDELCWVCGERQITCGHHFIYQSQSLATRYYLPNLIPICKECHFYAHRWQNLFSAKMVLKLGQDWYDNLMEAKQQSVKFNKGWIESQYQILQELYQEIS